MRYQARFVAWPCLAYGLQGYTPSSLLIREASVHNDDDMACGMIVVHLLLQDGRGLQLRSVKSERDGLAGTTISREVGERRAGLLRIVYGASLAGMLGSCR
jgi:hypothetical protein